MNNADRKKRSVEIDIPPIEIKDNNWFGYEHINSNIVKDILKSFEITHQAPFIPYYNHSKELIELKKSGLYKTLENQFKKILETKLIYFTFDAREAVKLGFDNIVDMIKNIFYIILSEKYKTKSITANIFFKTIKTQMFKFKMRLVGSGVNLVTEPPIEFNYKDKYVNYLKNNKNLDLSTTMADYIKDKEKFKKDAYLPTKNDKWTFGYGATFYYDKEGKEKSVKKGDTITQADALKLFTKMTDKKFGKHVKDFVNVPLNQNQYDALVSLVYNIGPGENTEKKKSGFLGSALLQKLNEGNYIEAAAEFTKWNKQGKVVLAGLSKRREYEKKLFETIP